MLSAKIAKTVTSILNLDYKFILFRFSILLKAIFISNTFLVAPLSLGKA